MQCLLLTNPNNPLSIVYKERSLVAALKWCLRNDVHLVRWGSGFEG
jgi:aspartate/methionine/tyrosine aminotransferase